MANVHGVYIFLGLEYLDSNIFKTVYKYHSIKITINKEDMHF